MAAFCAEYGIEVVDADMLSREVTSPDGEAMEEIVGHFGYGILDSDGGLDRKKMADLVFHDKKLLDLLSRIVHSHVIARIKDRVEKATEEKIKALVLDVPIPVKEGFLDLSDQVWLVWTDDDIRIKRLGERGMPEDEALRRISFQMTREEYEKISNFVIENNGSQEELREQVFAMLDRELHMRGIKYTPIPKDLDETESVKSEGEKADSEASHPEEGDFEKTAVDKTEAAEAVAAETEDQLSGEKIQAEGQAGE